MSDRPDWPTLVADVGRDVQRLRELLGWSQEALGRAAHVSQGAVSRLEHTRGLGVPLLTVWKVLSALSAAHTVLDFQQAAAPRTRALLACAVALEDPILAPLDPHLRTLIAAYHRIPARRQPGFVQVVVPIATLLAAPLTPMDEEEIACPTL